MIDMDNPWQKIETAPKDGTEIVAWFEPNEIVAPEKAKAWRTKWEVHQFKDGNGRKVGKQFGLWTTKDWKDPMSYAPTHWIPAPISI